MNVKEKIIEVSKILDEIENYNNTLQDLLSNVDQRICDLMHFIEYNKLKTNQCYRVVRELHKLRLERRKVKNDIELCKVLETHRNKLLQKDNRQILLSFIGKAEKSLLTSEYQNRVYSKEEILELIGE